MDSNATTLKIPKTIKISGITYKVTEIGSKAFKNNKKAKVVKLDKNITKIGDEAFAGCTNLTTVTIGSNVTTIGNKAFYNTAINSLTLPAKTTNIGKQFVGKCKNLKTLTIKSTKMTKSTLSDKACSGVGKNVTVKVPGSKKSMYKKLLQSKGLDNKIKVQKIK